MKYFFFLVLNFLVKQAHGLDVVHTIPVLDKTDFRDRYAHTLLTIALQASEEKFGPFDIKIRNTPMESKRVLLELERGDSLSVSMSPVKTEWLEHATPVYFPLMKGLASFRFFFISEDNKAVFASIQNLADMRKFSFGQGRGWSTVKILEDANLNVVYADSYEGMFSMLQAGRFDLLMRGIQEILPEKEKFKQSHPGITIATSIAFYTYLPYYFFVTKKQPRLAERLSYGLKKAYAEGVIDKVLMQYFAKNLQLLNANKRKIFYIENTNIDASFYQRDKPYLLNVVPEKL